MRNMKLTLKPGKGAITRFYAFVGGIRVIAADGGDEASWEGDVPDTVDLKIRAFGIGNATFKVGVDLPGTDSDLNMSLQLEGGYRELALSL